MSWGHALLTKLRAIAALTLAGCLLILPFPVVAQGAASDSATDAQSTRLDAVTATPNRQTPVPQENAIATAPGLEQQTPGPQITINMLAPIFFNSNAEAVSSGGTATAEGSPVVRASMAGQLGNLPIRLSASVSTEWDRFASASSADFDKLRTNLRAQYVEADNDQAYSPFIAFVPRLDFTPTFATRLATRYDLDLGVNKVFNFDGDLHRVAFSSDNSFASTVWSVGFSAGAQRRWRNPSLSSYALFLIPSVSYVINKEWNAEVVLDIMQRWYDSNAAHELTVLPIGILEYVVPDRWLGGGDAARWFGRPAIDFLISYERNWANFSQGTYTQWVAGLVFKAGWRF
jgi:hypothetical protein